MIDIGANLTHKSFEGRIDGVLSAAHAQGLRAIIVTGTSVAESLAAIELAHRHPENLFATAGVHPHSAADVQANWLESLSDLATDEKVVAIGETGLDFFRNFSPRESQIDVFIKQLHLASQVELPVFVHDRDSDGQTYEILKHHKATDVVVHCFTGTIEDLQNYLSCGCYIGITGWVCDERRGMPLAALVPEIPIDRLLIETDAPYLLPRTIRPRPKSRHNEPRYLPYVAAKVAELRQQPLSLIQGATEANARKLFRLGNG